MASKLDRLIQPGETVIFRRRAGLRAIAALLFRASPFVIEIGGFYWWYESSVSTLVFLILATVWISFLDHRNEAVVTDLRILYREGLFTTRVTEIPLWHVQEILHITYGVIVLDRAGRETVLDGIPRPENLAEAIVAQTGVPAPKLPKGRVKWWNDFAGYWTGGCGLAMLMLLVIGVDCLFTWYEMTLALGLALVLALFPVTLLALFFGFGVGLVLLLPAMRVSLPLEEVRAFFNPEERPLNYPAWIVSASNFTMGVARRFASLLYGERI